MIDLEGNAINVEGQIKGRISVIGKSNWSSISSIISDGFIHDEHYPLERRICS